MKRLGIFVAALLTAVSGSAAPVPVGGVEHVVLLHGLGRTRRSFASFERYLTHQGYRVHNISYPSRKQPIEELERGLEEQLMPLFTATDGRVVHVVTHSMGGILFRRCAQRHALPNLGRVVMLAPPNQGSEAADFYHDVGIYEQLAGPAGQQLGTGPESVPIRLGPVDFELGVIAGNRSWNPILSLIIPGPDDGKVSVDRARVDGMKDFLVVPRSHVFIMLRRDVQEQAVAFLRNGSFQRERRPTVHAGAGR